MRFRRGIFIKMFAWFWAVTTVVITITLLIDRYTGMDPRERHIHLHLEVLLKTVGPMAVAEWEKGRPRAASDVLNGLQSAGGVKAFLFARDEALVVGGPPAEIFDLARRSLEKGGTLFFNDHRNLSLAVLYKSPGGKDYVLAGQVPWERFHPSSKEMKYLFFRLAIALVVSGLACYLLARYLTVPIIRLGETARRFAAGDFQVRVPSPESRRWDEIGELAFDFNQMAERISALISSQRRLLANISHELRSPLARMNVALELARKVSHPEAEKALRRMEWEAERLNELISKLLTFSRLDGTLETLKTETLDLEALLKEIVEDADFEAQSRNREVRLVRSEPVAVRGDKDLLYSALENVIRNALSHTPEGTPVTVTLRSKTEGESASAEIQVRDRGPGVPVEDLEHIFRPFFRVRRAGDLPTSGSGLGLAITERAVHRHGGTVRARNAVDGGLVVEITLPSAPAKPF